MSFPVSRDRRSSSLSSWAGPMQPNAPHLALRDREKVARRDRCPKWTRAKQYECVSRGIRRRVEDAAVGDEIEVEDAVRFEARRRPEHASVIRRRQAPPSAGRDLRGELEPRLARIEGGK